MKCVSFPAVVVVYLFVTLDVKQVVGGPKCAPNVIEGLRNKASQLEAVAHELQEVNE